jgi:glycerophosphoryl diester phosphodiesterase
MSAHRGGGKQLGPENTLEGIREAVRRKVPLIEIDVRRAKDGSLFLFHDHTLREGNNSGPSTFTGRNPETLSAAERALVTVGAARDQRLPTFSEALRAIAGSATAAQLDIKGDIETVMPLVATAVTAAHAERNIVVQCRDVEMLKQVRARYPTFPVLMRATHDEQIAPALAYKPELVQVDEEWLSDAVVQEIHAGGSRVLVKVLAPNGDYSSNWKTLFERGVDVLLTDYPARMAETLAGCTPGT